MPVVLTLSYAKHVAVTTETVEELLHHDVLDVDFHGSAERGHVKPCQGLASLNPQHCSGAARSMTGLGHHFGCLWIHPEGDWQE